MIGCLRTSVRKQPIIALYFESENELKFYNLETRDRTFADPESFVRGGLTLTTFLLCLFDEGRRIQIPL